MGYDVQLIQIPLPSDISLPLDANKAKTLMGNVQEFDNVEEVEKKILAVAGTRRSDSGSIDYLGRGLNYARIFVKKDAVHIENNCSVPELLKIYNQLVAAYPSLLILDLQSKQLHNADSFIEWWSRPLY